MFASALPTGRQHWLPCPTLELGTWENQPSKSCAKMNEKNFNNFYLSRCLATNSRSITRFDCHKAMCLPNDVQECL